MERRGEESNALRLAGKLENRGFRSQPNYNSVVGYSADKIRVSKRTSAIIDPPDGRLPPWTLEQVNAYEMREEFGRGRGEADWTIDRPPSERCINVVSAGLLGLWGMANAGRSQFYSAVRGSESFVRPEAFAGGEEFTNSGSPGAPRRILQAPGYVAITHEESDEYTIIPLDGRPHLGAKFLQWTGDVRGHWEGNTLVVETTNIKYPYPIIYSYASLYPGSGETLRLTERFTRVGPDTIEYRYTIDDPKVYTRPYTVLYELTRDDNYKVTAPICHEGHDDMPSALAAGRVDEEGAIDNAEDARLLRKPRLEELKQQALKTAEGAKKGR
jgi:hypothetical protein